MGRRELGDPDGTGDYGTPEQPSPVGGDSGVEQASGGDRRSAGTSAERVPAKSITREDYTGHIRGQGEPIPDHDRGEDRGSGWESGAGRNEQDSDGDLAGERAGSRDRETYADEMRAESDGPIPGDRPDVDQDSWALEAPVTVGLEEADASPEVPEEQDVQLEQQESGGV
jgi:hypothetical protein